MNRISDVVLSNKVELGIKQLRGRIAHILLMFADQVYKSDIYELPVSRKEVGELIDMRTENVVRILSEFRKDQLIGIEGKKIEIKTNPCLKRSVSWVDLGLKNSSNNIFNANITEKVKNKFPKLSMAFHIFGFSHQFYGCRYNYSVNAY